MKNPAFHKLLEEVKEMHDKKNADYGGADPLQNLKGCVRMGDHPTKGIALRLQDKMSRIENYFLQGSLKNESVRDSFLDMGIYALLAVTILDGENNDLPEQHHQPTYEADGCDPEGNCQPQPWSEGDPQYVKPADYQARREALTQAAQDALHGR